MQSYIFRERFVKIIIILFHVNKSIEWYFIKIIVENNGSLLKDYLLGKVQQHFQLKWSHNVDKMGDRFIVIDDTTLTSASGSLPSDHTTITPPYA